MRIASDAERQRAIAARLHDARKGALTLPRDVLHGIRLQRQPVASVALCNICRLKKRHASERLVCDTFAVVGRKASEPRWLNTPSAPTRVRYLALLSDWTESHKAHDVKWPPRVSGIHKTGSISVTLVTQWMGGQMSHTSGTRWMDC